MLGRIQSMNVAYILELSDRKTLVDFQSVDLRSSAVADVHLLDPSTIWQIDSRYEQFATPLRLDKG